MTREHVVLPTDGIPINRSMVQKIRRGDLPGGCLGIIEGLIAPGQLIAPHVHADVDEVSYVLAGEITAEIGGEVVVAPAGSYLLKPYGVMHAFWNSGSEPARVMEMHLPGGFEEFYREMTTVASDSDLDPDTRAGRIQALNDAYRVKQHPELVEDLKRRHRLP
ncbi:MAG: cupin domain-containing protein [Kineosporiaceae bacterium]